MTKKGKLTDRQQEIFDLLEAGNTPAEAGAKAKPPISANAVYMTIRRIEEKGHKVKVTESPRGRSRGSKPGPKPKPAAQPQPEPATALTGTELIERIEDRRKKDIADVDATMAANREERERLGGLIETLDKEHEQLGKVKEQLAAA